MERISLRGRILRNLKKKTTEIYYDMICLLLGTSEPCWGSEGTTIQPATIVPSSIDESILSRNYNVFS